MKTSYTRRWFLQHTALGRRCIALPAHYVRAASRETALEAGEGVVDTTPPLGIELGGFHRAVGNERRIAGIRRPTAARALVLRMRHVCRRPSCHWTSVPFRRR